MFLRQMDAFANTVQESSRLIKSIPARRKKSPHPLSRTDPTMNIDRVR